MNGEATTILVVDDEPYIADLVSMGLRYQGYGVTSVGTGRQALVAATRQRPDLVVLDVMLPDLDGFEVCRRLRAEGVDVPVVFLTARDAVEDRVAGLDIGDDYVTKPFSLEELMARVRAVLRRTAPVGAPSRRLEVADLVLDEDLHEVTRAGVVVDLTPTEFRLLRYLMANTGMALSKAKILAHVWEYDFGGDANVLETYVSYLRRKIDRSPLPPAGASEVGSEVGARSGTGLIQTVRGVGYTLRPPRQT